MWGRQPSSPRRNYQSLPYSRHSTTLPKLFLHPSTNPNFSGSQYPNSLPNSTHRSFQLGYSNLPSPTIHSSNYLPSPDLNIVPIEFPQQNYKFPLPNNHDISCRDICLNKSKTKKTNELSFEGKPYTTSYINLNYRHFLTPIEEKEILNYTEIYYLRRNPKKKKMPFRNINDNLNESQKQQTYCENGRFSEGNEYVAPNLTNNLNEGSHDCKNEIYNTIKSKINEDLSNNVGLNEIPKNNLSNIQDEDDNEFQIGDHVAYRYEILSKVGYGAFGFVLKCYDHKMLHIVALKMIKETHETHPEIALEAKFLENLQSDCKQHHIVELYESFTFRNYFCISMEFINTKSLIYDDNEDEIRCKFSNSDLPQLFDAVFFIHSNGILHCDLKPSNILFEVENKVQKSGKANSPNSLRSKNDFHGISQINSNSRKNRKNLSLNAPNENRIYNFCSHKKILKIIDFGCSCYIGQCPYEKIQSLNYRSPEVVLRIMPYTTAIDIWSIGCIIFETAVGTPLFNSNSERELISEMVNLIGQPPVWMVEKSSRASKFFSLSGNTVLINLSPKQNKKGVDDNDDLIKNGHDKNILSPIISPQNSIGDLSKISETNFKISSPTSKNTTVRKNKFSKNKPKSASLKARIASIGNPHLLSIIEGCLSWDPHKRLNAEQLLNHPWSKIVK